MRPPHGVIVWLPNALDSSFLSAHRKTLFPGQWFWEASEVRTLIDHSTFCTTLFIYLRVFNLWLFDYILCLTVEECKYDFKDSSLDLIWKNYFCALSNLTFFQWGSPLFFSLFPLICLGILNILFQFISSCNGMQFIWWLWLLWLLRDIFTCIFTLAKGHS